jgi:hypothetical protein
MQFLNPTQGKLWAGRKWAVYTFRRPVTSKPNVSGRSSSWRSYFRIFDTSEPVNPFEEKEEYDPLRDGPLRYLGYSNEIGEAFASWLFPGGVLLSYAVALGYVIFDAVDKYRTMLSQAKDKLGSGSQQ